MSRPFPHDAILSPDHKAVTAATTFADRPRCTPTQTLHSTGGGGGGPPCAAAPAHRGGGGTADIESLSSSARGLPMFPVGSSLSAPRSPVRPAPPPSAAVSWARFDSCIAVAWSPTSPASPTTAWPYGGPPRPPRSPAARAAAEPVDSWAGSVFDSADRWHWEYGRSGGGGGGGPLDEGRAAAMSDFPRPEPPPYYPIHTFPPAAPVAAARAGSGGTPSSTSSSAVVPPPPPRWPPPPLNGDSLAATPLNGAAARGRRAAAPGPVEPDDLVLGSPGPAAAAPSTPFDIVHVIRPGCRPPPPGPGPGPAVGLPPAVEWGAAVSLEGGDAVGSPGPPRHGGMYRGPPAPAGHVTRLG